MSASWHTSLHRVYCMFRTEIYNTEWTDQTNGRRLFLKDRVAPWSQSLKTLGNIYPDRHCKSSDIPALPALCNCHRHFVNTRTYRVNGKFVITKIVFSICKVQLCPLTVSVENIERLAQLYGLLTRLNCFSHVEICMCNCCGILKTLSYNTSQFHWTLCLRHIYLVGLACSCRPD